MKIYALAYGEMFGHLPEAVELRFLGSPWIGTARVREKDLEKIRRLIEEVSVGIRLRHYEAKPEYVACGYCAYEAVCPHTGQGAAGG
jgi:CRISPR/Cas system-associated exonuclease Cas4 (RecB family)